MPLESDNQDEEQGPRTPCARCSAPAEWVIWDHHVCIPCGVDWNEKAPHYADISAKYGDKADPPSSFRKFTAAWVATHGQRETA